MQDITKNKTLSIKEANICLLISFATLIGYQFLGRLLNYTTVMRFLGLFMSQIIMVLPGLFMMLGKRVDIRRELEINDPKGVAYRMAVAAMACSYPIVIILNLISMSFVRNVVADALPQILSLGLPRAIIITALLPAVTEEFLFRGILYHSYRRVSVPLAAIVSALFFGLMHLNLNQMPYAFFLGIVLALMVEATGSIYTSVFMHFLLNAFSVAVSFTSSGDAASQMDSGEVSQIISSSMTNPSFIAVLLFVFLVALVLLIIVIRRTFKKNGRVLRADYSGGEKHRLVDIYFIIFLVASLVLMIKGSSFV